MFRILCLLLVTNLPTPAQASGYKPSWQIGTLMGFNIGMATDVRAEKEASEKEGRKERVAGARPGASLHFARMRCQDIGCSGQMLSLGIDRSLASDGLAYHSEVGLGAVAIFMTMYGGVGLRQDDGRLGIQATAVFGSLVQSFIRVVNYPGEGTLAGIFGFQVIVPIFSFD